MKEVLYTYKYRDCNNDVSDQQLKLRMIDSKDPEEFFEEWMEHELEDLHRCTVFDLSFTERKVHSSAGRV